MLFAPVRSDCALDFKLQMEFPYHQPSPCVEFSSPSSSRWDVEQQHQQASTPSNQSNFTLSPMGYQQQLSPIDSPVPFVQNDPQQQLQQQPQQQQQPQLQQQQQSFSAPHTIHLEERVPPRPNQLRIEFLDPSYFEQQQRESTETRSRRRASSSKPSASRGGGEEVTPGTSPSSSGAGPSRVPHGRAHANAHPYRRPRTSETTTTAATSPFGTTRGVMSAGTSGQAAAGRRSASAAPSSDAAAIATRTERVDCETLAERTTTLHRPSRGGVPAVPSHVLNKLAVPCPAFNVWRASTYNDSGEQQQQKQQQQVQGALELKASGEGDLGDASMRYADPSLLSAVSGESSRFQYSVSLPLRSHPTDPATTGATTEALSAPQTSLKPRRLLISTNLYYDTSNNEVVAELELPGVKKEALNITLATCPITGCRQLKVQSSTKSSIPVGAFAVHERRTGACIRYIYVPLDTQVSARFRYFLRRSVTSTPARRRLRQDGRRTAHHQVPRTDPCASTTAQHRYQLERV